MNFDNYCEIPNNRLIAFGQIKPEHLFIHAPKYDKNIAWANYTIDTIEKAKIKVQQKASFVSLINFIASEYNNFFKKNLPGDSETQFFGKLRKEKSCIYTYIASKNRYAPYVKRAIAFVEKKGRLGETELCDNNHLVKYYKTFFKPSLSQNKRALSVIVFAKDKLSFQEKQAVGKFLLKIESPTYKSIKAVFKKIEPLYKIFVENKDALTPENIGTMTKEIAKIHWYLSQVTPFYRGSSGIADVFCKTLFESKGIQISRYKKNLDPNLEAYVFTLDEYTKEYKNFFKSPLVPIKA